MKKVVKILVIGLTLLFLLVLAVPISYDMEVGGYALMISGAHEDTERIAIQIRGRYTWRFLRRDRFRGNFMIEGYSITQGENYFIDIDVGTNTHQWLEYRSQGGRFFNWHTIGQIYTSNNFRYFVILPLSDGGYIEMSGKTITAIVYPTTTRNCAVILVNKMIHNLSSPITCANSSFVKP